VLVERLVSSVPEPLRAPYAGILVMLVGCILLGLLNLFTHALGGSAITVVLLVVPFVILITMRHLAMVVGRGLADGGPDAGPARNGVDEG
jgi:hypothetical protein